MRRILGLITVFLVASPMAAYIPQSTDIDGTVTVMKWSTSSLPITWQMNPTIGSKISGSREQATVFRESFQEWANITTAAVSFTEGSATDPSVKPGFDRINLITTNVTPADFNSTAVGLTATFSFTSTGLDQFGRTVEFPGQILEADIMFNPSTSFSTNDTMSTAFVDLESVMTHEVGHLLGLDHSNILSSTMFPSVLTGLTFPRNTKLDDQIGISTIYPSSSFLLSGTISGIVRTTENVAVFGAMVVALDPNGQAAASAVSDPNGQFTIQGLPEGTYLVYAEPMNQPFSSTDVFTLDDAWPGYTVNTNFTVRFR